MSKSTKEEGIRVCSSTGHPTLTGGCGEYVPQGKVVQLNDSGLNGYIVSPKEGQVSSKSAIVAVYDIFGLDIVLTRRFVDMIAEQTRKRVLMPDFFHGHPWPLSKFPPTDPAAIRNWVEDVGKWEEVSKDLKSAHQFLVSTGVDAQSPLGIIGFCWGGKQVFMACSGDTHAQQLGFKFGAGVVLHGSFIGSEDAEKITVPILFMPAGNDPPYEPIKEVLDKKSFGSQCKYHRFETEVHGFAAGRGDWTNECTRKSILKAAKFTSDFFGKHLPQ
ncbi:unnamed protein product [Calicophoron daubneyi]|uniref:Dienelactone hydrolase domain-containing protein n=1 Tax=Calicophoron daubneyi TaxID=300641 RepID=A0AAV2TIB5_CALDB